MSTEEKKNEAKAGCLEELLMFLIGFGIAMVMYCLFVFEVFHSPFQNPKLGLIFGIIASIIYAVVVYSIPRFRRNMYIKGLGFLSILDAIWWTYLLFVGD